VADKSNFGNAGNGMPCKLRYRRRGVDPPRNESEITGNISSNDSIAQYSNAGNGPCITVSNAELETHQKLIRDTRSLSLSASMILSPPGLPLEIMTIGNSGQISSMFLTGLVYVQRSCRSRRRGDANTTFLHVRHTCTSVCHQSYPWSCGQKSNISKRISSGSVPIVTCRWNWPMPLEFTNHSKRDRQATAHLRVCCLPPIALFGGVQCTFQKWGLGQSAPKGWSGTNSPWSNCLTVRIGD